MSDLLFKKDIEDTLDSLSSDRPLSARQGKLLLAMVRAKSQSGEKGDPGDVTSIPTIDTADIDDICV